MVKLFVFIVFSSKLIKHRRFCILSATRTLVRPAHYGKSYNEVCSVRIKLMLQYNAGSYVLLCDSTYTARFVCPAADAKPCGHGQHGRRLRLRLRGLLRAVGRVTRVTRQDRLYRYSRCKTRRPWTTRSTSTPSASSPTACCRG